mmetsp:Transcript_88190/g.234492  ORF Transcript_88190/g.234492 Transcript_88190/m.234492 type:complete len:341 (+) Transcript_88190:86-1108(+)
MVILKFNASLKAWFLGVLLATLTMILIVQLFFPGYADDLQLQLLNIPLVVPEKSNTTKLISICNDKVVASTPFAFVSMLSGNIRLYSLSAAKLGISIRRFSDQDLIMLEILERPLESETRELLHASHWQICAVSSVPNPPQAPANKYLDALMYTKLRAFGLEAYEAIAIVDSDTLVVGDPSPLFDVHVPNMVYGNYTVAAVRDHPIGSCIMVSWKAALFNAGVLLVRPSLAEMERLVAAVAAVPHDFDAAEQALLNVVYPFPEKVLELPPEFNANVVSKRCEPKLWSRMEVESRFVVVHYTMAKGWTYSMSWRKWDDFLQCWEWGVQDWCRLWESLPPAA